MLFAAMGRSPLRLAFGHKIKITYTPTTSNGATWRMRISALLLLSLSLSLLLLLLQQQLLSRSSGIFRSTSVAISAPKQKQTAEATTTTKIVYIAYTAATGLSYSMSLPLSLYVCVLHIYKIRNYNMLPQSPSPVRFMKIIHSPPQSASSLSLVAPLAHPQPAHSLPTPPLHIPRPCGSWHTLCCIHSAVAISKGGKNAGSFKRMHRICCTLQGKKLKHVGREFY